MLYRRDLIAAYHRRLHDIQSTEARESKAGSGYFEGAFALESELAEEENPESAPETRPLPESSTAQPDATAS